LNDAFIVGRTFDGGRDLRSRLGVCDRRFGKGGWRLLRSDRRLLS
jgi:hypothetical protein